VEIKLKSLTLKTGIIQSPMAGCTAFRIIGRQLGMEFAFLEMVSSDALIRENDKTYDRMKTQPGDKPLGAQLVGCDPGSMGEAAAKVEEMGYDLLDINLGCPVSKVVAPGGGSALLVDPEKCHKIFKSVVESVRRIPVTVKMRKGYEDPSGDEAVKIAKIAEDSGLSAVTVHGRTRAQGYSGEADWDSIGRVKRSVKIPVFGNGDVEDADSARRMKEVSGCDGVMLGRGALGNPWVYRSIHASMEGMPLPNEPSLEEIKKIALQHFDLEIKLEGSRTGVLKSRRILCWYFKSQPRVAEFRNKVNVTTSVDAMRDLIVGFGKN